MMTGIVNIYGVIGELPDNNGKIITPNTTFLEVARQVESQKEANQLNVHINSPGGLINEGDEIYDFLESQKKNGKTVNTYCESECASMATKLFLVGDKRVIRPGTDFMIHNPGAGLDHGDADDFEAYSKAIRGFENDMIKFYSEKTGTSKETLKPLMKKETTLTPEQSVEFGFATNIEEKVQLNAVAFSKQFNPNYTTMSDKTDKPLSKKDAEGLIDNLLGGVKNMFNPKALKTVQDANGNEINFPDLEPDDTPSQGDKVDADKGDYVMPSGETYVVEDGQLSEIKPKEREDEEGDEEMEALKSENEKLKKQVENSNSKVEALKKEKSTLENKDKTNTKAIKELEKGLTAVKKSIGSNFEHGDKQRNYGEDGTRRTKSRSVFKDK